MNQQYAEAGVKRQDTLATMAIKVLMILGVFIALFLVIIVRGIFGYVGVAIGVGVFFLFPKLHIDYEYIYVDGQIDFDRITGKSKRKTMLRIDFEQVEIMAPSDSSALDSYKNMQLEKRDFSSLSKDSKPYVIIASSDNKKMRIIFEPSEKIVDIIKQKNARKLVTY